jgi:anthranilate synthase component II
VHGKMASISHAGESVFRGLPSPFLATRYHSLVVKKDTLPSCLKATAETPDGLIMALAHESLPVHGVQFHPESITSQHGHQILRNFLDLARDWNEARRGRAKVA